MRGKKKKGGEAGGRVKIHLRLFKTHQHSKIYKNSIKHEKIKKNLHVLLYFNCIVDLETKHSTCVYTKNLLLEIKPLNQMQNAED